MGWAGLCSEAGEENGILAGREGVHLSHGETQPEATLGWLWTRKRFDNVRRICKRKKVLCEGS